MQGPTDAERTEVGSGGGGGSLNGEHERGREADGQPLLDAQQKVTQMNAEVSVSRTGRGLETDGFTQAGGERGATGRSQRYKSNFFI